MGDDIYIFTTGLEGMIHMWRFNTVSSLVEYVGIFEGHVREVTSIILKGKLSPDYSPPPSYHRPSTIHQLSSPL